MYKDVFECIELMEPKIKKALNQTKLSNRDDLEQSIKLKIIESFQKTAEFKTEGFFEFKTRFEDSCNK